MRHWRATCLTLTVIVVGTWPFGVPWGYCSMRSHGKTSRECGLWLITDQNEKRWPEVP
ncbi:hypothetical protein JAAARDRAFT_253036 [Jaapia argillacea MUCL 33604]|uniref:Uncharacterized protein n=1 Tax=Jaapia argillacea MUCL 33604 TaxID=933084 RepID=A0A067PVT1_9AGAM|nr:hypothetical protein JAAARDRAFT_253036 [Jaapia argillacea MUCL 33604]